MGTSEMVGSMGLTFFCNRCVEVLYNFRHNQHDPSEFNEMCEMAIAAFTRLKWPTVSDPATPTRIGLFNTNEEITSVAHVLAQDSSSGIEKPLDDLIEKLKIVLDEKHAIPERKRSAQELQHFFDKLGDSSFYTTREYLRTAGEIAGV